MAAATQENQSADAMPPDKQWDTFLESHGENAFMQTSWWAEFLLTRGWDNFGVVVNDEDSIVGGARVLRYEFEPGHCFYYIPEGPILPTNEADGAEVFQQVMDFINEQCKQEQRVISHVRLEPRWQDLPKFAVGLHQARDWLEPRNTLCINLSPPERDILAQMKPKGRYNIGVARRHGVSIVEDVSANGIEDFLEIYEETADRQNLKGKNQGYFRTLIPQLSALNHASVFFAEYQRKRITAVLVVYFGNKATYFFGGSRTIHRNVMAPYLLHFEIMLQAKRRGCQWYDMYGVAPLDKPEDPWANISVFKRKLGGEEIRFVRTLDAIYNPAAYEKYQLRRKSRRRRKH